MDIEKLPELLCTGDFAESDTHLFSPFQIFLSVVTTLGNALILVALRKESSLHPPSKLLYSCLAFTDLLIGIIVGPAAVFYFMKWRIDSRQGINLCVYSAAIAVFTFAILTSVSLLTLTAISVDRLLALSLRLRYRQVVSLRKIQVFVVSAWIPSIGNASVLFWDYKIAKIYNCTLQSLCLLISAFCYSRIFLKLHRHQTEVQDHAHQEHSSEGVLQNIKRYRETVCTAILILVTLVICYLPHIVVTAIFTINGPFPLLPTIWGFTGTLVLINSSLNPLIYSWRIREVRQAVKMTIRQVLCLSG